MKWRLPRNADIWFPGWLRSWSQSRRRPPATRVWVVIADHYEPLWHSAPDSVGRERVALWKARWPAIAEAVRDSAGRPPKYTFFYPEDEYRPELVEPLAEMARSGIADVEIHIHHDGEGEQNFVDRMSRFKQALVERHALLHRWGSETVFGFIHGNWCLDNSRPDGRWCGLNNELQLLRELGCYADFTLPSVPSATQTRMVNTIYWATDDPQKPKSHDWGIPLQSGGGRAGDLLIVPGPLALNWRAGRRWAPRVDTGELAGNNLPSAERVRLWLDFAPQVGTDVFVKLYTHGTQERNSKPLLLEGGLQRCFQLLLEETRRRSAAVYFVSAWEMWLAIEAVSRGDNPLSALQF